MSTPSTVEARDLGSGYRAALAQADPSAKLSEPDAQALASAYTSYIHAAREALTGEEAGKLVDAEEVREWAVRRVEQTGIVEFTAGPGQGAVSGTAPCVSGHAIEQCHAAIRPACKAWCHALRR